MVSLTSDDRLPFEFLGTCKAHIPPCDNFAEHLHSLSYMLEDLYDSETVSYLRNACGIYHSLVLFYRYRDYCDRVFLSMTEEDPFSNSRYLSNINALKEFYGDFVKKARPLFAKVQPVTIQCAHECLDERKLFFQTSKGEHSRYAVKSAYGEDSYVTMQEMFCINLLDEGKSYKEIANILDISHRTVETYITRAKDRTSFRDTKDILMAVPVRDMSYSAR